MLILHHPQSPSSMLLSYQQHQASIKVTEPSTLPKLPAKAGCVWSQWLQILIPEQANDQSHFPNVVYTYRGSGGACTRKPSFITIAGMFFSHSCFVHTSYSLIASVVVTVVKMNMELNDRCGQCQHKNYCKKSFVFQRRPCMAPMHDGKVNKVGSVVTCMDAGLLILSVC